MDNFSEVAERIGDIADAASAAGAASDGTSTASVVAVAAASALLSPATDPATFEAASVASVSDPATFETASPDVTHVLYIDACIARETSRTERLARAYLAKLERQVHTPLAIKSLVLAEAGLGPLTEAQCARRMAACRARDYTDPMFAAAHEFRAADLIVLAAPYWDLSFPSIVKNYIEQISVDGLTFIFDEQGRYAPQVRAKKLVYITSSGGYIGRDNFGYDYVRAVFDRFFGITQTEFFAAEGLDIKGADIEGILAATIAKMEARCK